MDDLPKSIDRTRLGRELKRARKERGLTQAEAADLIDVGRTTMVAIEKGTRALKATELVALARGYGRSVSDFVRPRPEIEAFRVEYRGPLRRGADERETLERYEHRFESLCRDYLELEEITGSPLVRHYPPEYTTGGLPVERAAEEMAIEERQRLGLGTGPLRHVRGILEEKVGMRIFYMKIKPSSFSEMYYYDDRVGACMAVNRLHPPERRRWSLAHGYVHFLAHRHQPVAVAPGRYERLPERERLADLGAMFLLMPTSEVAARYNADVRSKGEFTPADLCLMADYFGVSVEAIARRLEHMRLLPAGTWEHLKDLGFKVREAQEALGIEREDDDAQELPLRYQYLALQALENAQISEGRFARFLRMDRLDARTLAQRLHEQTEGVLGQSFAALDPS
jgi:Zn-dependent peptidase ImmA (M78 family)/DNA-binding XRE family transcriptional regulator